MIARVRRPSALPSPTDRFVVVEASAGTGKTFFLEHRVVDLILAGAELSQILLVTFTEKAVAELRMRIRDLLDRMARAEGGPPSDTDDADGETWEIDDNARARLRAALNAFDHAPIFTIHGFCHRVLIEDAFRANRLFEQTQVADEVAFDAAYGALLRERFASQAPDRELLEAYLEAGKTTDNLRDLLLKCARAEGRMPRRYDPVHALAVGRRLTEAFDAASRSRLAAEGKWKTKVTNIAAWFDTIGRALDDAGDRPAGVLWACDTFRKAAENVVKGLSPAKHADAIGALKDAIALMPLDEAIASELLPHVVDRIGKDKAERGLFDYKDMLDLVLDALEGERGPEIAATLRARMPWVMIDEFQDTDPVQWDIFRRVWMHADARGLTIVGDPKQAIYSFRGADVATYIQARDALIASGARQVTLSVNRRSTAPLVDAVNHILVGTPLTPLLDRAITYETQVTAAGDVTCSDARPPITVFELQGGGRDEQRTALAQTIGAEIERIRQAPARWQTRGTTPPFSLGHIMVLTRSNKESVQVASALRGRGLACALVESDRLFQTREAAELAAVLDAIASPRDRSARLRALRTRFFDVPWDDVMGVVDAPDHHPLIARMFDWAALAGKRDYEQLFRRLVEDSRFVERALVLGGGERAHVNTWHLIELLLEELARSRCDLSELVVRLRRWIHEHEDMTDDRDVQRAETDGDAIRILTIHKAKGLEAPYVFLFGCSGKPPSSKVGVLRDDAGRTLWVSAHDEKIKQQIASEQCGENQRLAYVALTRAQVRLYLPLYMGERAIDGDSTYFQVQRCLAPMVKQGHALVERIEIDAEADEVPPPPADALATFDPPSPPAVAELAGLAAERTGFTMLSYTRLAHDHAAAAIAPGDVRETIEVAELNADESGDDTPEITAAVATEDAATALPGGATTGQFLHGVLEDLDLAALRRAPSFDAWLVDEQARAVIEARAREYAIDPVYLPAAARLVFATLREPLALTDGNTLPPLVEATQIAREVEFAYPAPGVPTRAIVKGFIDALVAYDDELWVLDYKSDHLEGGDLAQAARAHVDEHYLVQARLYALAADRFRGRRRVAGLLYSFIRYGIVVPLRIEPHTLADWSAWLAALPVEAAR